MIKTIHKFLLLVKDTQTILASPHWKPLSIQMQGNQIVMWTLVYPGLNPISHTITCIGTGHDIHIGMIDPNKYLGTVQDNALVRHFFEQDH